MSLLNFLLDHSICMLHLFQLLADTQIFIQYRILTLNLKLCAKINLAVKCALMISTSAKEEIKVLFNFIKLIAAVI